MVDEVVPRDTGNSLDTDGVGAADPALAGFPFADVLDGYGTTEVDQAEVVGIEREHLGCAPW
jgi:hypothetical protein